jgi:hypothetical protein
VPHQMDRFSSGGQHLKVRPPLVGNRRAPPRLSFHDTHQTRGRCIDWISKFSRNIIVDLHQVVVVPGGVLVLEIPRHTHSGQYPTVRHALCI